MLSCTLEESGEIVLNKGCNITDFNGSSFYENIQLHDPGASRQRVPLFVL
jgi:hypothetical protein